MPIANTMADLATAIDDNYPKGSESAALLDDAARALAGILRRAHTTQAAAYSTGTVTLGAEGGVYTVSPTGTVNGMAGLYSLGVCSIVFTNTTPVTLVSSSSLSVATDVQVSAGMVALVRKQANGVFVVDAVLPAAAPVAANLASLAQGVHANATDLGLHNTRINNLEAWVNARNAVGTTVGGTFGSGYNDYVSNISNFDCGHRITLAPGLWEVSSGFYCKLTSGEKNSATLQAGFDILSGSAVFLTINNFLVVSPTRAYVYEMAHHKMIISVSSTAVLGLKLRGVVGTAGDNPNIKFAQPDIGEQYFYAKFIR